MRKTTKAPPAPASHKRKRLTLYIVIAVCLSVFVAVNIALIFYFSEENKEASANRSYDLCQMIVDILCPDFDQLDGVESHLFMTMMRKVIRKVAHFLEFALLGFLSGWLMLHLNRRHKRIRMWMTWVFPAVFCLINAAFDEIHQIFSERGPSVWDVCIDFSGALFGLLLIQLIFLVLRGIRGLIRRRRQKREAERQAIDSKPPSDPSTPAPRKESADA